MKSVLGKTVDLIDRANMSVNRDVTATMTGTGYFTRYETCLIPELEYVDSCCIFVYNKLTRDFRGRFSS